METYRKYIETEKYLKRVKKEKNDRHKCKGCVWGRFTGVKYVCLLPNCLKGLGIYKE